VRYSRFGVLCCVAGDTRALLTSSPAFCYVLVRTIQHQCVPIASIMAFLVARSQRGTHEQLNEKATRAEEKRQGELMR